MASGAGPDLVRRHGSDEPEPLAAKASLDAAGVEAGGPTDHRIVKIDLLFRSQWRQAGVDVPHRRRDGATDGKSRSACEARPAAARTRLCGVTGRALVLAAAMACAAAPALANCSDSPRSGVDWRNCALYGRDFSHSDLSGADMTGSRFTKTDFTGADLTGAELRRAKLIEA
jgi:hypothetical protein